MKKKKKKQLSKRQLDEIQAVKVIARLDMRQFYPSPDGNVWCRSWSTDNIWLCTREPGHPGPHVAVLGGENILKASIDDIWFD